MGWVMFFLSAIVDRDLAFVNTSNILEHRNISDLFSSLIPANPIFIPLVRDDLPWVGAGITTPIAIRIKAVGGILFNAIAVKLVSIALPFANYLSVDRDLNEFIIQFVINTLLGANLVAIFSSFSDLESLSRSYSVIYKSDTSQVFLSLKLSHE
jgi:hypothetical protein